MPHDLRLADEQSSFAPCAVFVYGTLMQGEERSGRWPRPPRKIEPATIRAELYDLGPYPAIAEGDDRVLGEIWHLAEEDMAETLKVLDEIECFGQQGVDLYVRRTVVCTVAGGTHPAHAYFIADPAVLARGRRIPPDNEGRCRWQPRK